MARKNGNLDNLTVKNTSAAGLHSDGGNLYLNVSKSGSKSWIFRYKVQKLNDDGKPVFDAAGKKKWRLIDMGLGGYPTVSLADARKAACANRQLLSDGLDPLHAKKRDRLEKASEAARARTFKECAETYIEAHASGWSNAKHRQQWANTLKTYVYPEFGNELVEVIDTDMVLRVLTPIWDKKRETARRVRGRIEAILDWAKVRGLRQGENPARLDGHLKHLLPDNAKAQQVKRHAALPYSDTGAFMAELRQRDAVSAKAFDFLILTAARTGDVIGAEWDEIDLEAKVWTVPAERMKARKEHRVPLSDAALDILREMQKLKRSLYVFPGQRRGRPLSNMVFLQLLKRMERTDITPHGFRSTFRDWVAERTDYPRDVAEMALAHTIESKVEAAYRRGDLFTKRRRLMDDWAGYCSRIEKQSDNVVSISARGA